MTKYFSVILWHRSSPFTTSLISFVQKEVFVHSPISNPFHWTFITHIAVTTLDNGPYLIFPDWHHLKINTLMSTKPVWQLQVMWIWVNFSFSAKTFAKKKQVPSSPNYLQSQNLWNAIHRLEEGSKGEGRSGERKAKGQAPPLLTLKHSCLLCAKKKCNKEKNQVNILQMPTRMYVGCKWKMCFKLVPCAALWPLCRDRKCILAQELSPLCSSIPVIRSLLW